MTEGEYHWYPYYCLYEIVLFLIFSIDYIHLTLQYIESYTF